MANRTLTDQDVQDVWAYEFDRDLNQKPEPYTRAELASHARGAALRPLIVMHESDRAIIGHAADDHNADTIAVKSESPVLAFFAGHRATSETRRWVGLSWKH